MGSYRVGVIYTDQFIYDLQNKTKCLVVLLWYLMSLCAVDK